MKVLISGAGIAGLTLALRLQREHHDVTVIEKSASLRDGGYMIDFFGSGYDAAERLGLLGDLERIHYAIPRLAFLDRGGREKFSLPYPRLRRLFNDRHYNFMRGDLERVLYEKVSGHVDIRHGKKVGALHEASDCIEASLSDGSVESVDLVVGADGLHSGVRKLAFGEKRSFKRYLGYYAAAFVVERDIALGLPPDAFYSLSVPGRQAGVYPIRSDQLATFFIHRAPELLGAPTPALARDVLHREFGGLGWIVPDLLRACDSSDVPLYFDEVAQIVMPSWIAGRVVLLGDACQCVSLLAGQGASMAMAGAFILAEELSKEASIARALARYERRMKPAIEEKQEAGRRMAGWFAPETQLRLAVRDAMMRMSGWPLASRALKRQFATQSVLDQR